MNFLSVTHPIWWLNLSYLTDFSCLSYPLESFILIIDYLMMSSAWLFEIDFEWSIFKGNCTLGVDRCFCTLTNFCADICIIFTAVAKMWWALGGDTLLSSPKGAEHHTDELLSLGQYLEGVSELAQVHFWSLLALAWKTQCMLNWAKKQQAREHSSFYKYILSAHHGVEYSRKFQSRFLTLQSSQSRWEITCKWVTMIQGDKFYNGCTLS